MKTYSLIFYAYPLRGDIPADGSLVLRVLTVLPRAGNPRGICTTCGTPRLEDITGTGFRAAGTRRGYTGWISPPSVLLPEYVYGSYVYLNGT